MTQFNNQSGLTFVDIDSERARTYRWKDGSEVNIDQRLKLNVSKSGGHRIFDAHGKSHYVSPGWVHLSWVAKEGQPHFVK
jgi:hypothetical protein